VSLLLNTVADAQPATRVARLFYVLFNKSDTFSFQREVPVVVSRGKPVDKGFCSALTVDLKYLLRGLLLIPRGLDEEADARNDTPATAPLGAGRVAAPAAPKGKPKATPPAPQTPPAAVVPQTGTATPASPGPVSAPQQALPTPAPTPEAIAAERKALREMGNKVYVQSQNMKLVKDVLAEHGAQKFDQLKPESFPAVREKLTALLKAP
jgi:hypothetical protein